jgi:hypothetical protein
MRSPRWIDATVLPRKYKKIWMSRPTAAAVGVIAFRHDVIMGATAILSPSRPESRVDESRLIAQDLLLLLTDGILRLPADLVELASLMSR